MLRLILVLLPLLAAGCTAVHDPFLETGAIRPDAPSIATEVSPEFAAAYLPSISGRIESVRQTATRFRRDGNPLDAQALDRQLKRLDRDATVSVVRAFSYFLQLANIAEDQSQVRQQREQRAAGAPFGLAAALEQLHALGRGPGQIRAALARAMRYPESGNASSTAVPSSARGPEALRSESSANVKSRPKR